MSRLSRSGKKHVEYAEDNTSESMSESKSVSSEMSLFPKSANEKCSLLSSEVEGAKSLGSQSQDDLEYLVMRSKGETESY